MCVRRAAEKYVRGKSRQPLDSDGWRVDDRVLEPDIRDTGTAELRAALGGPSNQLHHAVVELDLPKLKDKVLIDVGGDLSEPDT